MSFGKPSNQKPQNLPSNPDTPKRPFSQPPCSHVTVGTGGGLEEDAELLMRGL